MCAARADEYARIQSIGDIEHDDFVGFQVISTEDIDDYGITKVIEKIRQRIGTSPVYLSLDIDVVGACIDGVMTLSDTDMGVMQILD